MDEDDLSSMDYLAGITKCYCPVLISQTEHLKKSQACITGIEWLLNCWSHVNVHLEVKCDAEHHLQDVTFDHYEMQLLCSQGLPATQDQLVIEFTTLYEFACLLLKCGRDTLSLHAWWSAFYSTINRVFLTILEDRPALKESSKENTISMTMTILSRVKYLNEKCPWVCKYLVAVSCSACWLLLLQRDTDNAKLLAHSLVTFQQKVGSSQIQSTSHSGNVVYFTAACSTLLNAKECLQYLKKIDSSFCQYSLSYFTAFLLHDLGQTEEALEILSPLTKDNVHKELSQQLLSRISCLAGNCLYTMGKYNLSIDWYAKAIRENATWTVPLWHLANCYKRLLKSSAERKALRLLVQASLDHDKRPFGCQASYLSASESQYILASRLNDSGFHEESAEIFNNFLQERDSHQSSEWILVPKPNLSQIKVEAALTCLNANMFQECYVLTETVLFDCADKNRELERGLYRKMTDILDLCEETYSQKYGQDVDKQKIANTQSTSCYALLAQAVALTHLRREEEAGQVLRRILSVVTVLDLSVNNRVHEAKKCKTDENIKFDKGPLVDCLNHWQQLVSQVYGTMASLRLKNGLKVDAIHLLRVSLTAWPDNFDSLFNYVLLLLKLGENSEALSAWKASNLKSVLEEEQRCTWTFNVSQDRLNKMDRILSRLPKIT